MRRIFIYLFYFIFEKIEDVLKECKQGNLIYRGKRKGLVVQSPEPRAHAKTTRLFTTTLILSLNICNKN